MRSITHNGHKVVLYDSIEDLPITRYYAFNRYALIDSEIGSDLNAFYRRIGTVRGFIKTAPEKADKELENLAQTVQLTISKVSPKMICFVQLIQSIDGKVLPLELTEHDVGQVSKSIERRAWTFRTIEMVVESIKKKFRRN